MNEIEPDTRDWADVLEAGCPECGFTGNEDVTSVPDFATASAETWNEVLTRPNARERTQPDRWSDVEYAAHVRDILDLFRERTHLIITQESPTLPNFDGDAVAIESDYRNQDPAEVAVELRAAALAYAADLSQVSGDQWDRVGYRADGREFTVTSLTRYGLHELKHHLHDVSA
ncbi:MAG: DinB family protein [Brevibacterium aurantiacum]|uniref:DinB family protein n=1 Tax=Brevibacterium aurantiacum TaxID=273384 RepID=UPI0026516910|nr:DinB family protein [Brevibacterium aurantiacum]MDN5739125.1 DinB family protein [Brevibacterium aurantiacum]MDN5774765.1 DinB family protein [Brevibacterium aurantiacum]